MPKRGTAEARDTILRGRVLSLFAGEKRYDLNGVSEALGLGEYFLPHIQSVLQGLVAEGILGTSGGVYWRAK